MEKREFLKKGVIGSLTGLFLWAGILVRSRQQIGETGRSKKKQKERFYQWTDGKKVFGEWPFWAA